MTSTLRITLVHVLTALICSSSANLSIRWMCYDRVLLTHKLPETATFKTSAGDIYMHYQLHVPAGGVVTCHDASI